MNYEEMINLLWGFTLFRYLIVGTIIAVAFLVIPQPVWKVIAHIPGLTPNWVTLWRIPVTIVGAYFYFVAKEYDFGYKILVSSFMMDRIDGKMADATGKIMPMSLVSGFAVFWKEMSFPGKTETGKWLDPLVDKLVVIPLLFVFCYSAGLPLPAVLFIVLLEIASSLIRLRFDVIKSWADRNRQALISRISAGMKKLTEGERSSTGFGKFKIIFQVTLLLLVTQYYEKVFEEGYWALYAMLYGAILFNLLSVLSRVAWYGRLAWIGSTTSAVSKLFKH